VSTTLQEQGARKKGQKDERKVELIATGLALHIESRHTSEMIQ